MPLHIHARPGGPSGPTAPRTEVVLAGRAPDDAGGREAR